MDHVISQIVNIYMREVIIIITLEIKVIILNQIMFNLIINKKFVVIIKMDHVHIQIVNIYMRVVIII